MALRKLQLKTTEAHRGQRLDQVLAELLPRALNQPLSKAKVRKLIVAGAVYLNGKRVRIASKTLLPNAELAAFVDLQKLMSDERQRGDRPFEMTDKHILFEDGYLIAVNKPPGLPTQPTLDEARDNLFKAVKTFLSKRDKTEAYVGLHHRLDRDTSGVILFTKKTEANAGIADAFKSHKAQKIYQAITVKPKKLPPEKWTIENYLGKDKEARGKQSRFTQVRSGGDYALTEFRLLQNAPGGLLVEAKPKTGRTHQIRVHLSESGMPILGDTLYGGSKAERVMLHALSLTFPHPITNVEISVQSPMPKDLEQCLTSLKRPDGDAF